MRTWTIPLALVGCALGIRVSHADQCQWVAEDEAARAVALLEQYRTVVELCEPCGDRAPGIPQIIERATSHAVEDRYREVHIDGRAIDLAYTYVKTSETRYQNLALLVRCEAGGVSPSLRVEAATDDGVMIVSDATPVAAVEPTVAAPPPVLVHTPPSIIVVEQEDAELLWPALAGAGGASAIWLAWAIAVVRRRRRAMVPRAARLTAQ